MRSILWVSLILAITYFNFWPTPVDPKRWDSPNNSGYVGAFRQNTLLEELEFFEIAGTHGPEGLALGDDGMVYASSGEGWILRHNPSTGITERWVNTGGRPLGIAFDQNSNLLVADAFLGLLSISPTKTVSILANQITVPQLNMRTMSMLVQMEGFISATHQPNLARLNSAEHMRPVFWI